MNYKALNTDFTEEDLKLTWEEWIWSKTHWRIRNFIKRFERWWKYSKHLWKENSWNENHEFFRIIQLQLSIMAKEFENSQITTSAEQDAKDMKKVILLLDRYMDEYYSSKYYDEGIIRKDPFEMDIAEFNEWIKKPLQWKEGYSTEGWYETMKQDQKALDIAMRIIAQKSPGWWQ
jgi:hypothetical protein